MTSSFTYGQALESLSSIAQQHLLKYWEILSPDEKKALLQQIQTLDLSTFRAQQQLLAAQDKISSPFEPFTHPDQIGNSNDAKIGRTLMAEGAVGCLILAGGMGTRLDFEGPKGMFPISPIKQKSLFQLFAEKTAAASRQAAKKLPLALMVSKMNHSETAAFFSTHALFGLEADQLSIFSQNSLPLLDQEGKLFLEARGIMAEGPDGNGRALHHFYQSGLWEQWHRHGVRIVNMVLIDNPLADPFDAELFGYHHRQKNTVTVKCCLKQDFHEKVGVLVKRENKIQVVEYSELPDAARLAADASGEPFFKYANLSLFCFSMEQIKAFANSSFRLPLHQSFKKALILKEQEGAFAQEKTMAWKFETFIFDLLAHASKVGALLYPRENCFAPLKNSFGDNSIETVRRALQARDQSVFNSIAKNAEVVFPFEIAQDFYYPTPALLTKWQGWQGRVSGYIPA